MRQRKSLGPAKTHQAAPKREPGRGPRPGPRGWPGRGGGSSVYVQAPDEFRGTSVQVCGLWPFAAGAGSPMVGVPIGRNLMTGATLCCDPISWFQRARLISNPSAFVLGKPGLGKSTIIRRMALGLAGYGVVPFVLGDLKPDYVDLIESIGGQVVSLGVGRGYLNVLDPGQAQAAAQRLTGEARGALLADAHARRTTIVAALVTILRSAPPSDREETILDRALRVLDARHDGVPVLGDLLQVIREAPEDVRQVALDRGSIDRYRDLTENLEATLVGLISGGRFAGLFSRQTTTPMQRDRPVVFDVSSIDDAQTDLQAAVLLACWSAGFGTVNVAHALADAGLEPRRHYFVVLDELWRALRAGRGMVDRVDALTRLNRQRGVGMAMISHTMSDLLSLPTEEDRMKARGFVERSGMVICGGLPSAEMPMLRTAVPVSAAEESMLVGWQDPPAWDSRAGREAEPPGRGHFLVKVGGKPGIPVRVWLTGVESGINDTNKLWHDQSRLTRADAPASDLAVSDLPASDPPAVDPPAVDPPAADPADRGRAPSNRRTVGSAAGSGHVMSATSRRHGPSASLETVVLWTILGSLAVIVSFLWTVLHLAPLLGGSAQQVPANPAALVVALLDGSLSWGRPEWITAAIVLAGVMLVAATGTLLWRRRRPAPAVDRAAHRLGHGRDLAALTSKGAAGTAARLGSADAGPGLPIGRAISGGAQLFSNWEDVTVDIWGPRTGKTTSRAIPAILAAPGAVVVTSNKRDIVDATRGIRAGRGRVWVFDPQDVIGEPATWWWNPLTYVTDEVKARVLADLFASGSRDSGAKSDAFFDGAGRDLLAGLLLAAAVDNRPITQVYEWLCRPGDDEPVDLLLGAGYGLIAGAVSAAVLAPDRQRAGVYATAQQAVGCLTNRAAMQWVTPGDGHRAAFVPAHFVHAGAQAQTLYAVSKEGRGTLGPLVAALTVAVTEAAEALAKASPGGRLKVPMVAVLDEAANVCRWPDLPDLYSHYGSRGIVIMTILQSWSQGVVVWGREGMRKLWSSATIRVYGGGVAETEFLSELAQLTGEFDRRERSRTDAKGGASSTHSVRSERVLEVADLAAMPRGRALLIPSGAKPVLIATQPWMDGPHADDVRAGLAVAARPPGEATPAVKSA